MSPREPLFDIVKAIQVAEKEALDTLGVRTAVEQAQRRRAAKLARQARRWDYVQRRANTGLTKALWAVSEAELAASGTVGSADDRQPEPTPDSMLAKYAKLLKW